jgi:hypothetical protein
MSSSIHSCGTNSQATAVTPVWRLILLTPRPRVHRRAPKSPPARREPRRARRHQHPRCARRGAGRRLPEGMHRQGAGARFVLRSALWPETHRSSAPRPHPQVVDRWPASPAALWHRLASALASEPVRRNPTPEVGLEQRNPLYCKGNAEREGFEPSIPLDAVYRISRSRDGGAGPGTDGHRVFRIPSLRASRGRRRHPRWGSVGTRFGRARTVQSARGALTREGAASRVIPIR